MGKYDDLIYMQHPEPRSRKRMPSSQRAAQFMPFAALGDEQGNQVREANRLTERRIDLDEYEREDLDRKLAAIIASQDPELEVKITYFLEDLWKDGGEYVTVIGQIQKMDPYSKTIIMADGTWVPITEILRIECSIFNSCEE